jgi:hypothetical protein
MTVVLILAFKVITVDDRFVITSNMIYPDLFWTLRGGGVTTFGIVTSAIAKARQKLKSRSPSFPSKPRLGTLSTSGKPSVRTLGASPASPMLEHTRTSGSATTAPRMI